jgi:hypothetical protein
MPEAFQAIKQLSQQRTWLVAVSCISGPPAPPAGNCHKNSILVSFA